MDVRRAFLAGTCAVLGLALPAAAAQAATAERARGEARLWAIETDVLGAEHALEHARARRSARSARTDPTATRRTRRTVARAAQLPDSGRWTAPVAIPGVAIHQAVLPTGKILYFDDVRLPNRLDSYGNAHLLDPRTGAVQDVDPPTMPNRVGRVAPINIFCSGISYLSDGRVLVTGGTWEYDTRGRPALGLKVVLTFNPFTETWERHGDMRDGRWYPGQERLPDGRTVIMDGRNISTGESNDEIEIFDPASNRISSLGMRGGAGRPPVGSLYPRMHTLPSGRTLVAGPNKTDSWLFTVTDAFRWENAADQSATRSTLASTYLPGGPGGSTRVMLSGGEINGATLTNTTETFDEANPGVGWRPTPALNVGRAHHNVVHLPDGSMVAVGGGNGVVNGNNYTSTEEQKTLEIWDPVSGSWTRGPAQAEKRTYHGTAVLLPDARVLSAGDDGNGGSDVDTYEVYEPGYLFRGSRPTITGAPGRVDHGQTFGVGTPDANVTRAVMTAPASVTHGDDMNQRSMSLNLARRADGSGVDVTAPANGNIAPNGWYMLFLVNDRGVPSVARFVHVGGGPVAPGGDRFASQALSAAPAAAGAPAPPAGSGATRPGQSRSRTAGTGRRALRLAKLRAVTTRACGARTRACRRLVTRLRFTLTSGARLTARVATVRRPSRTLKRFTIRGRRGVNSVRLPGRRLRPGRYRMTLTPAGSRRLVLRFTVQPLR